MCLSKTDTVAAIRWHALTHTHSLSLCLSAILLFSPFFPFDIKTLAPFPADQLKYRFRFTRLFSFQRYHQYETCTTLEGTCWSLIQGKKGGIQVLAGLAPSSQTVGSNKDDQEPPKEAPTKSVDQIVCRSNDNFYCTVDQLGFSIKWFFLLYCRSNGNRSNGHRLIDTAPRNLWL